MKIASIAYRLGDRVMSNPEILELVRQHSPDFSGDLDATLEKIDGALTRSGARERRWLAPGQRPIDMTVEAIDEALERAGMQRQDIGLLCHVGLGRGFMEAGQGAFIAQALDRPNLACFDLMDACQSWNRGLMVAHSLLHQGAYENILLVNTECNMVDGGICYPACFELKRPEDLGWAYAGMTLADGVCATILRKGDRPADEWRFDFRARTDMADACAVPVAGYRGFARPSDRIAMNGEHRFYSWARDLNKVGYPICRDLLSELPIDRLKYVFFHGHHDTVWNAMLEEVGADPALNAWNTYRRIGNLASACVPVSLRMAEDAGALVDGDEVASLVGSGGMSFSAISFRR